MTSVERMSPRDEHLTQVVDDAREWLKNSWLDTPVAREEAALWAQARTTVALAEILNERLQHLEELFDRIDFRLGEIKEYMP